MACTGAGALILASCSWHGVNSSVSSSRSGTWPQFSLSDISNNFSAMATLGPIAAKGNGRIAVLLPNNATASFFAEIAAPDFKESFQRAGLAASEYTVQLSEGSDQFDQAKAAIASGATVLVLDARYSGEGISIESYAQAHHVEVIDYDFLTVGGSREYYVSFDSLKIGVLLGQGLVNCVSAWHVKHPHVVVMQGAPTDYNVAMYTEGYDAILARQFANGWKDVSNPPGTWDGHVTEFEFQQQYTAHKGVNAALIPNDEVGWPVIAYLKKMGVKPRTFPITGLDATLLGLQNILAGYQCGTVYKPSYVEAEAAAALALYVRAGVEPPAGLLNWNITDPQTGVTVPGALLTPEWVTTENMASTVVADKWVSAAQLCAGYAADCATAGIPDGATRTG
jgi:D-xylose transport system substrate-binding protein